MAIIVSLGIVSSPGPAPSHTSPQPYLVYNDRGGKVRDRLLEIRYLRASGQPVEIRGDICYSTCTMLLGLPRTCISPNTVFGFHGPMLNGKLLKGDKLEYYSRVIAQYYPEPLRNWYMITGRNKIGGMHLIRGIDLIRMGIRSC